MWPLRTFCCIRKVSTTFLGRNAKMSNNWNGRGQKGCGSSKCPMIEDVYPSQNSSLRSYKPNYIEKSRPPERLSGIIARCRIKCNIININTLSCSLAVKRSNNFAIFLAPSVFNDSASFTHMAVFCKWFLQGYAFCSRGRPLIMDSGDPASFSCTKNLIQIQIWRLLLRYQFNPVKHLNKRTGRL